MNKTPRFQPKFLLLLLGIVCILLVILSTVSSSVNNSVRGVINTVLMPMQKGLNKAGSFVSDSVEDLVSLREVQAENEALQEELAFLRQENAKYQLKNAELEEYRDLLSMKEEYPDYDTIGAHVIGENSTNWNKTILIDRGSADGIQVDMNVIAQGGLVGIVTSVTSDSATVRTINDHNCQVGAMALITKDTCIVKGDLELYAESRLIIERIDKNATIAENFKIVTSNRSSLYLPGILIGYVSEITEDPNSLTKSGYLIPVVDFSHLDSVLVITELKETGD